MLRAALVLLLFIPLAIAQPPREEFPPPSALPRTSEELANGKTISRPLQPTARQLHNSSHADWLFQTDGGLFDPDPTNFPLSAAIPFQTWLSADLSLAWASRSSLPPLATSNLLAAPTLNHPATTVVLGNGKTPVRNLGGGRFTAGWWADGERTLGLETTFHVLGTATESERVNGGGAGNPLLARPLFNSRTGEEDVVYIAHPRMLGALTVSQSLRVQGWDATALLNLLSGDGWFVHAIGGYRYFQANEGLRFDQTSEFYRQLPDQPATAAYRTSAADQIDAHNRFHGGLLGLRTQYDSHGLFVQLDAKVSLGQATNVVRVSGQTVSTADLPTGRQVSYFPSAVFGQPSNFGRHVRQGFAVLPEAGVKLGVQFAPRFWGYVGYQFIYLSEVVRAADQIDRVADLSQTAGDFLGRPTVPFHRTDFWVQGVSLGFEWRY